MMRLELIVIVTQLTGKINILMIAPLTQLLLFSTLLVSCLSQGSYPDMVAHPPNGLIRPGGSDWQVPASKNESIPVTLVDGDHNNHIAGKQLQNPDFEKHIDELTVIVPEREFIIHEGMPHTSQLASRPMMVETMRPVHPVMETGHVLHNAAILQGAEMMRPAEVVHQAEVYRPVETVHPAEVLRPVEVVHPAEVLKPVEVK